MTTTRTIRTAGTAVAALGTAAVLAACGGSAHAGHSSHVSGGSVSGTPAADRTLEVSLESGHLAGPGGRSLYLWVADGHDQSHCSGACAAAWPPLLSKTTPTAGRGVRASDLGTITRGSSRQVTYDGHPLYYFAGDSGHATRGQGSNSFGAKWWLVSPSGSAITHGTGSRTSSSGSGSGW